MHCAVSSCKVHRLNRFAKNTEDPGLKLSEDNKRKLTFHNRPYIKSVFNNGWWVDAYPSSYPLDPPLVIRYGNYYKRYFSHLASGMAVRYGTVRKYGTVRSIFRQKVRYASTVRNYC